jgi:hypothetical protein
MKRSDITPALVRALIAYDPETGMMIWLPRGKAAWDAAWAGKPALNCVGINGYRHGAIHAVGFLAHRVAWALHYGEWPEFIDHINGDRTDNRIANLRSVQWVENGRNYGLSRANKSGHTGVSFHKPSGKWRASIAVAGKHVFLGSFPDKESAVAARQTANETHGFHQNHGRKSA